MIIHLFPNSNHINLLFKKTTFNKANNYIVCDLVSFEVNFFLYSTDQLLNVYLVNNQFHFMKYESSF